MTDDDRPEVDGAEGADPDDARDEREALRLEFGGLRPKGARSAPRCPECWGTGGQHAFNCPEGY